MRSPQEQINLISEQEIERIQNLIEQISGGSIPRILIERELQERIRMMEQINRINQEQ